MILRPITSSAISSPVRDIIAQGTPAPSTDIPANAVYYNGEPVYYDGEVVTHGE